MSARKPKLCCARYARLGECSEPVEDAYFCRLHWLAWDRREAAIKSAGLHRVNPGVSLDRLEQRGLWTPEPASEEASAA